MNIANTPAVSLTSRILGTSLCCVLAVGACFADAQTVPPAAASETSATVETSAAAEASAAADAVDAVSELSVAPLDHKIYPDDRPEWISAEPVLEGSRQLWPVVSLPSLTPDASQESLRVQMQIAVEAYINHLTDSSGKAGQKIQFDDQYIADHLVNSQRRYSGVVTTSGGEMYEDAVELVFEEAFREQVRKQWRGVEVGERLAGLGVLGVGGLVMLLGLTSLLKVCNRGCKAR